MNKYLTALALIVVVALGVFIYKNEHKETSPVVPNEEVVPQTEKITYKNASQDLIQVELPFPGAVVGKDFTVIGKARGMWFFEASFPMELRDKDGKVIATGYSQAQSEWMTEEFVSFKGQMKAPDDYIGDATLVLMKDNASGLPEHDASISYPIVVEY